MKYIYISFKSRNALYSFLSVLRKNGVIASTTNTPSNISSSCSLSIKTDFRFYNIVLSALKFADSSALIGVFGVERNGFNETIQRLR